MNKEPTKEQICETIAVKLFGYKWVTYLTDLKARFYQAEIAEDYLTSPDWREYAKGDVKGGHYYLPDFFADLQAIDDLKKKLRENSLDLDYHFIAHGYKQQHKWVIMLSVNKQFSGWGGTEGEALARAVYAWLESEK